jgi:hypothetical protein
VWFAGTFILQVFNKEDEALTADYLRRSADIYSALPPIDVRKLDFLVAIKLNLKTHLRGLKNLQLHQTCLHHS